MKCPFSLSLCVCFAQDIESLTEGCCGNKNRTWLHLVIQAATVKSSVNAILIWTSGPSRPRKNLPPRSGSHRSGFYVPADARLASCAVLQWQFWAAVQPGWASGMVQSNQMLIILRPSALAYRQRCQPNLRFHNPPVTFRDWQVGFLVIQFRLVQNWRSLVDEIWNIFKNKKSSCLQIKWLLFVI